MDLFNLVQCLWLKHCIYLLAFFLVYFSEQHLWHVQNFSFFALIKSNQILNHSILQFMFNFIVLYTIHIVSQSHLKIFFTENTYFCYMFCYTLGVQLRVNKI